MMQQQQQQQQHSCIIRNISAKQQQIINFKTQKYKRHLEATTAAATNVATIIKNNKTSEICYCNSREKEYQHSNNHNTSININNTCSNTNTNSKNTTQHQQYQQWRRQQQKKVKLKNHNLLLFLKLPTKTIKEQHQLNSVQQHQSLYQQEEQKQHFNCSNQLFCHLNKNNAITTTNTQSGIGNLNSLEAVTINQQQQQRQQRQLLPLQLFITIMLILSFLTVQHVSCQQFMSVKTTTKIQQFKPNSYLNNAKDDDNVKTNNANRQNQHQQEKINNNAYISQQHKSVSSNISNTNSNLTEIYKIIYSINSNSKNSLVSYNASNYNYKAFFKRINNNRNNNSSNSINSIITKNSDSKNNYYNNNSSSTNKIIVSAYVANKSSSQNKAQNNASSLIVKKQHFYKKNILRNNINNNKIISNILSQYQQEQQQQFNKATNSYIDNNIASNNNITQFDVAIGVDAAEEAVELLNVVPNRFNTTEDNQKLMKLVMDGLGLQNLPNMKKANISQQEYALKYHEYLQRIHERKLRELSTLGHPLDDLKWEAAHAKLYMVTISHNVSGMSNEQLHRRRRDLDHHSKASSRRQNDKSTSILLRFPLDVDASQLQPGDIEEANIRLMLITSSTLAAKHQGNEKKGKRRKTPSSSSTSVPPMPKKHLINLKVYQLLDKGRRLWLDGQKIEIEIDQSKGDETSSRWLEFDVTKAVESWLSDRQTNFGLEVKCDNCYRFGARIIDDLSEAPNKVSEADTKDVDDNDDDSVAAVGEESMDEKFDLTPVLNIIGRLGAKHQEQRSRTQSAAVAAQHHHTPAVTTKRQPRKTNCYKDNQRCCRHTMEVIFKEIKGFEFIIQPKVFDAGYCRGRCPPRYNPAHHHALLQSLIWKQDRTRVPRPCCAPSKLVELEVLHVDEKNSEKLKISTWTDMRVLECACS